MKRPRNRLLLPAIPLLLAVAFLASACSAATTPVAASPTASRPLNIVVAGDSYSAAIAEPPFEPGTETSCQRSANGAYARLLQRNANVNLQAFVACSGAVTSNLDLTGQHPGLSPQFTALTPQTDAVIFTIGGNDLGFSDLAAACVQNNCAQQAQVFKGKLPALSQALGRVIQAVRERTSPHTRIIILGYGPVLPDPATFTAANCPALHVVVNGKALAGYGIDQSEVAIARQAAQELNDTLANAANAAQVEFLNPPLVPLCEPGSSYEGIHAVDHPEASFHPTVSGEALYAQALEAAGIG